MLLITPIFITLVALIGLVFSIRKKGRFQKIITMGLFLTVLVLWGQIWQGQDAVFLSALLKLALSILTIVYGLVAKEVKITDRITILMMGLMVAFRFFFYMYHLPGKDIWKTALVVPIALFLRGASKNEGRSLPKEFGFMLIWVTIATELLIDYLFSE